VARLDSVYTSTGDDHFPYDQERWFFGPYGWFFSEVIRLSEPIHCRGYQGLWHVSEEIDEQLWQTIWEHR
jgi:hypothetical protein